MVAVKSTMQSLGSAVKPFALPDVTNSNEFVDVETYQGHPLLLMFICNHCPYVLHIAEAMVDLANKAATQGCGVLAISSNDVQAYPQDDPQKMAEFAGQYGFKFPYLFDETQEVAKAFGAACTPDFFVYDAKHRLQYRGQMDSSRPSNSAPVNGQDLLLAMSEVMAGKEPNADQKPSIGCNIKWKPGNEPEYF